MKLFFFHIDECSSKRYQEKIPQENGATYKKNPMPIPTHSRIENKLGTKQFNTSSSRS